MPSEYTLEWLDNTVAVNLNHLKCDAASLEEHYLSSVIAEAAPQAANIRSEIKRQMFALAKESRAALLIRQYHAAIISLYDAALESARAFTGSGELLCRACESLCCVLSDLLLFLEKWYGRYLNPDERLPVTYTNVVHDELRQRMAILGPGLIAGTGDEALVSSIAASLVHEGTQQMTFRELLYAREVTGLLEGLGTGGCSAEAVNDLLAYMNFNGKPYIAYLARSLTAMLDEHVCPSDKAAFLLTAMKAFRQVHRREGVRLNLHDADLHTTMDNWFLQELDYLERTAHAGSVLPVKAPGEANGMQKLICALSVDQIALLIRSADEAKVLVSRSVNAAFRSLVPFLSTVEKRDISPDSMRSKSYSAERRDKDIIIARLEQMISIIRSY